MYIRTEKKFQLYKYILNFNEFELSDSLLDGLRDVGYNEPTPIQEKSIPSALKGKDILGAAQTGTGKTGAFVIPILEQICKNPNNGTQALILTPTRELAHQIDEQIFAIGYHTGLNSATIIGGEDFARQAESIRAGVDIIVATPGRLIDQMKVLEVDFSNLKHLVLDEADRMLDMGFFPDVKRIITSLPEERQTLFFSATMPPEIQKMTRKIMKDPIKVEIEISKPAESVEQQVYFLPNEQKIPLTEHLLDALEWNSCIIFTSTKRGTDKLGRDLQKRGLKVATIHGDRDQEERNKALHSFKTGEVSVIVATDVLARGIDIDDVSLIINFDVPKAVEDYIHRIGRTGRYDKTGVAITFVNRQESHLFKAIEQKVGDQVQKKHRPDEIKSIGDKRKPQQKRGSATRTEKPKRETQKDHTTDKPKKVITINGDIPPEKHEPLVVVKKKDKAPQDSKKGNQKKQQQKPKSKQNQKQKPAPKKGRPKKKVEVKRIEKATSRHGKSSKPAKGVWGIIKSIFRS